MERKEFLGEEWKGIPGYPDYEVSTHGRVKRVTSAGRAKAGYILTCPSDPYSDGHRKVNLNGVKTFHVSKLVAEAFLGPCPIGYELHHADEDPTNDWLYNLEYITGQDHRLITAKHNTLRKLSTEDVEIIRNLHNEGMTSEEVGRRFRVSGRHIRRIVDGTRREIQ